MRYFVTVLLVFCIVARAAPAMAGLPACEPEANVPVSITHPLTDEEVRGRIEYVHQSLEDRKTYAAWWKYGFAGIFGIGAAGQFAIAATTDEPEVRADGYVGGATALLGVIGMLTSKVDVSSNLRALEAYPAPTSDALVAKLQCAETLLADTAAEERYGRGWQEYVISTLVSGSSALLMWLYFDQPDSAWLKVGSGVLFSQLRIHMTPSDGVAAWRHYQSAYGVMTPGLSDAPPGFRLPGLGANPPGWRLNAAPGALTVSYVF